MNPTQAVLDPHLSTDKRPFLMRRIGSLVPVVAFVLVLVGIAQAIPATTRTTSAEQCAFPFTPTAYEDLKDRKRFLDTIELAAFNMLFPGDPYFGLPDLDTGPRTARVKEPGRIPPTLLKSIAWIESSVTQSAGSVPFGSIGPSLIAFDCGHGIAQVTTGMTVPNGESGRGSPQQALVATHFAYNIARGAWILADKWNQAPKEKPIAGVDTMGLPVAIENWYYAVWAYNGFTGPGSNKSNHPLDPVYGQWPRMPYSCGPTNDGKGHNRANYPYQELVFGCAANPPVVEGKALWTPQPVSLPDLNNPLWRTALRLENFVFPYSRMDIPTPSPFHIDMTPQPDESLRDKVLGSPNMSVPRTEVRVGHAPNGVSTVETIDIVNSGTGVLAWYAVSSVPWLKLGAYTGVAVGADMPCLPDKPCDRTGRLEVSVDTAKAPPGRHKVYVQINGLGTTQAQLVAVDVQQVQRLGGPGVLAPR